jgi:hypothetical protein
LPLSACTHIAKTLQKRIPRGPPSAGRQWASTRIARLSWSLWQKLNLVHAPAPARHSLYPPHSAALDRRGEPSRDGHQQAGGVLARRLKPRKSLWAVMGSRMRRMPARCLPDACSSMPEGGAGLAYPPLCGIWATAARAALCSECDTTLGRDSGEPEKESSTRLACSREPPPSQHCARSGRYRALGARPDWGNVAPALQHPTALGGA